MTSSSMKAVLSAASLSFLVSACQSGGEVTQDGVNLTPPEPLLLARNVVRDNLEPKLFLNDNREFVMTRNADGSFSGSLPLVINTTYKLNVEWHEFINGNKLLLATLDQDVRVSDTGGAVLNLSWENYNTDGIDNDGDGFSNLEEREASSDPNLASSTPNTIGNPGPQPNPEPDPQPPEPDPLPMPGEATVIIPFIDSEDAPEIDGDGVRSLAADGSLVGEWEKAVQSDLFGDPLGINSLMIDRIGDRVDATPHRRWAAMHDGEFLYVLVLVEDVGRRYFDSDNTWEDDSLELFIDGNNSQFETWLESDDDDFQHIIPIATRGGDPNTSSEGRLLIPINSARFDDDFLFATGPGIGPDGIQFSVWEQDVYELRIPLEDANIVPDAVFGFELQVNDDDTGGPRDAKWGWDHESRVEAGRDTDNTFRNPSLMGRVKLAVEPL